MAIDSDLDDDTDDETGEDARGLRAQLGKIGKHNKQLAEKLARYETRDLLTEKGFDLVEPEEIVSLPEADRLKRAEELQGQRRTQQENLLKKVLEKVGLDADDPDALEEMVQELLGKKVAESDEAGQIGRARELGRLDSSPVPAVDTRKLHGEDLISHGLQNTKTRRSA